MAAGSEIKPYWQSFLSRLEQMSVEDFRLKQAKSLRVLRDDGATYNIYGHSNNFANAWSLDLVPFLIGSQEWGQIEAGLTERAEL